MPFPSPLPPQPKTETDPDYILIKRFDYSLAELLKKHPEGVEDRVIAEALGLSEEQVEQLYQSAVVKLRNSMKVKS